MCFVLPCVVSNLQLLRAGVLSPSKTVEDSIDSMPNSRKIGRIHSISQTVSDNCTYLASVIERARTPQCRLDDHEIGKGPKI